MIKKVKVFRKEQYRKQLQEHVEESLNAPWVQELEGKTIDEAAKLKSFVDEAWLVEEEERVEKVELTFPLIVEFTLNKGKSLLARLRLVSWERNTDGEGFQLFVRNLEGENVSIFNNEDEIMEWIKDGSYEIYTGEVTLKNKI